MNAKELLQCAPRLSESNRAYVLLNNGDRAIIVPPGTVGKKITVRACDADGVQSGPVKKVSPKELRLEPLPAPPAPLRLAPWCVNCGSPAMLRCMAWGGSVLFERTLFSTPGLNPLTSRVALRLDTRLHLGSGLVDPPQSTKRIWFPGLVRSRLRGDAAFLYLRNE